MVVLVTNKKAWLRIVEASVAILIILAAILIIYGNVKSEVKENPDIQEIIRPILKEIAQNSTLRDLVFAYDLSALTPKNEMIKTRLSSFLESKIKNPALEARVEICAISSSCPLTEQIAKDVAIYTDDYLITSNLTLFAPRRLKIFIWEKM